MSKEAHWSEIPKALHPVRCGGCGESWFVRTQGQGGVQDRDFWPRQCCYCGLKFTYTVEGDDGPSFRMDGRPIEA